jgi:hypothetical protein
MKHILKAWLRKNELTPDPDDMTAIVSAAGTIDTGFGSEPTQASVANRHRLR